MCLARVSSYAEHPVVAYPDQPVISANPASAQRVVPPRVVGCVAVGCAVRWLTKRGKDPNNREGDHYEDRGHNNLASSAPHVATVATADVPMVTIDACFGKCHGRPMEAWTRLTRAGFRCSRRRDRFGEFAHCCGHALGPSARRVRGCREDQQEQDADRRSPQLAVQGPRNAVQRLVDIRVPDTHGDLRPDYRLGNFETFGMGRCRIRRLPNGDPHPSGVVA